MNHQSKNSEAVASARAYLGDYFENIVIMCDLFSKGNWKNWEDPYGNQIKLLKIKPFSIKKSNHFNKIKDIYAKSSFELISSSSYWCFLLKDYYNYIFWFLGYDGRLRCISYINDEFKNHYPILSGHKILKMISEKYLCDDFETINDVEGPDFLHSFRPQIGYVVPWPSTDNEIQSILEEINIG